MKNGRIETIKDQLKEIDLKNNKIGSNSCKDKNRGSVHLFENTS